MDASNTPLPGNAGRPVSRRAAPATTPLPRTTKIVRRKRRRLPAPPTPRALQARAWGLRLLVVLFAFACGPLALWSAPGQRALPAIGIGCILYMLLLRSPSWGVVSTLLYLCLLGGVRRWIVPALGLISADPLLLVAPGLVVVYTLKMLLTRRIPADTRLARTLLWLLAIMFFQIFNPLQGGLNVGLAGALFTIVPILWYYFGRNLGREAVLRRLLMASVAVAFLAALYGLYQTYFGLPTVEMEWVKLNKTSYNALYINDTSIRAFSFFTSAQEYMQFVSIGVVILWAAFLRGARLALIPIPLLAAAIFLSGIRSAVVITLVACAIVWAVQGRTAVAWGPRLALALVLASGGLFWSLQQVQTDTYDKHTQALISHQVKGLLNPADSTNHASTAPLHAAMVLGGVVEGFKVPVGHGLGATTLAASKFNEESRNGSTEADISDSFAALGFAGGLVYLCVVFLVLSSATQWWRATRSLTALACLGILVVHIGHWLHGGSYAATMVVWFIIGGMERSLLATRAAQSKEEAARAQDGSATETSAETDATPEQRAAPQDTPRARWQARQKLLLKPGRSEPGRRVSR